MTRSSGSRSFAVVVALLVSLPILLTGFLAPTTPAGAVTWGSTTIPGSLSAVSCASPGNCTAVGTNIIANEVGGKWTSIPAPIPAGANPSGVYGAGISCPGVNSCVAITSLASSSSNLVGIEMQSSGSWTAQLAPLPTDAMSSGQYAYINSITCPNTETCVAVGSYYKARYDEYSFIDTLSGGVWTSARAPLPSNAIGSQDNLGLNSVACTSTTTCVAVGSYDSYGYAQGLIETLSNGTWQPSEAALPSDAVPSSNLNLTSVACSSASQCSAIGSYVIGTWPVHTNVGVLEMLSGGIWTIQTVTPPASSSATGDVEQYGAVACASQGSCVTSGVNSLGQPFMANQTTAGWVSSLTQFAASSISCPVDGGCTAVGSGILTQTGGTWSYLPLTVSFGGYPGNNDELYSLSCMSAGQCTAVGFGNNYAGNYGIVVTSQPNLSLSLVSSTTATGYGAAGQTVSYSYLVTNTGDEALSGIAVTDNTVATVTCPLSSLAPGASETCTGTYTVTQADVDRGSLISTAVANASGPVSVNSASSAVTLAANTAVSSASIVTSSALHSFSSAGQSLDYSYLVANTGTTTLGVDVGSSTGTRVTCPSTTIAPGVAETCASTYLVTATDGAAGSIVNVGTVTGTSASGTVTSATSQLAIPFVPTLPSAPVIGSATAGDGMASVSFSPPQLDGGSAIGQYTVVAADLTNPSRGGQSATGSGSPIVVTGLTNVDVYSFTVSATNALGGGPQSTASNSVQPLAPGMNVVPLLLPPAVPGSPYSATALQVVGVQASATGYVTTLKWFKVTLPKGMKLSASGVLSGTPSNKLGANVNGTITIKVTETVVTLNGKQKVKTKTSVQATISLPVS